MNQPNQSNQASQDVQKVPNDQAASSDILLSRFSKIIWYAVSVLNFTLGLRVLFKMLGANPNNPLAQMLYQFTEPFLWLFKGLFQNPSANGRVLEITTIVAILIYTLAAWALIQLMWVLFASPRAQGEV